MLINGDKVVSTVMQFPGNMYILKGKLSNTHGDTADAVGGVLKLQNTFGFDLIITKMFINVLEVGATTVDAEQTTIANTIDVGVDDKADTSNDTLFDGLDISTATGFFNTTKSAGTNGLHAVVWKKDEYVVATAAGATQYIPGTGDENPPVTFDADYVIVAIPR
jgi:hypothetical protein